MNADASNVVESPAESPVSSGPGRFDRLSRISPVDLASLVVVLGFLGWSYAANFQFLQQAWEQPDYTHGYLVLPIALWILWKRWPAPGTVELTPWWPAWLVVVPALAARYYFLERGQNWSEAVTLMPVMVGLAMARLGWRWMLKVWPAFVFLLFLFPLPPQLNTAMSQPLQSIATTLTCNLLKLTGLWVMPEGNVILVGNEKLEVAAACNGLSMLMSLAAVVTAFASLIPMSTLKRGCLLVSIVPIALGSNILRITVTAWCYYLLGAKVGENYAHFWAGMLMMPTAMLLVALELSIISWVVVEIDDTGPSADRMSLDMINRGPRP
jgi:exosortase